MDVSSYLKLPEVALRLGVSEKSARRYIKSGALPSIFVGNAYRVHPDELKAFVERTSVAHSTIGGPEAPKAPSSSPVAAEDQAGEERQSIQSVQRALLVSWTKTITKLIEDFDPLVHNLTEPPSAEEYNNKSPYLVAMLIANQSFNTGLMWPDAPEAPTAYEIANELWEAIKAGEPVPADLQQKLREFYQAQETFNSLADTAHKWVFRSPEAERVEEVDELAPLWARADQRTAVSTERQVERDRKDETE